MLNSPESYRDIDNTDSLNSPSHQQPTIWQKSKPPRLIPENRTIEVYLGDTLIAKSKKVIRVIGRDYDSTTTFYVPREYVRMSYLQLDSEKTAHCKWRGEANYFNVDTGSRRSQLAACHYESPVDGFAELADHVCFHPSRVSCYLDGERVWAERDDPNGAWLTSK